jgi:hypothetical protein
MKPPPDEISRFTFRFLHFGQVVTGLALID